MARRLRVLVIDDSAVMRKLLSEILSSDPELEVVGSAMDPIIARTKIKSLQPDVLTLDIEMPRMDGLSFLEKLMRLHPLPVVMIAANTGRGAEQALDAMRLGAVDFIAKPAVSNAESLFQYADEIIEKVKAAGRVDPAHQEAIRSANEREERRAAVPVRRRPARRPASASRCRDLILIGASTGGTEAIRRVLTMLPGDMPPIVVVQHIPPVFSSSFANRLNEICELEVLQAEPNMSIIPGRVVVAPGDYHLLVREDGSGLYCELNQAHKINHHRPSVDVMFRSCLDVSHAKIACLLTGMGNDGALGLEQLKQAGATTIAQDQRTSVIWGMPGAAVQRGCVDHVEPIEAIAGRLLDLLERTESGVPRGTRNLGADS